MPQFGVRDLRVDLWLTASGSRQWANFTSRVLTETGVTLRRGRTSESGKASPAECSLSFENQDGYMSPRYAAGPFYGDLMVRNQPMRVGFGRPVQGGVRTGTGTSMTAPQIVYTEPANLGVVHVSHMIPAGNITAPAGYSSATEVDTASFTYERSFKSQAGGVLSAATSTASVSAAWAAAHVVVPNGTLAFSGDANAQNGAACGPVNYSTTQGNRVVTAVCFWSQDPNGRMQPPVFVDQLTAPEIYMVADSGPSAGPRIAIWAWRQDAVQDGSLVLAAPLDGETDSAITVCWWDGADDYSPRFTGEVADWPLSWDKSSAAQRANVKAGGALRRVVASQDVLSPLRAGFMVQDTLLAYWPMEEPAGATEWQAVKGPYPMLPRNAVSAGAVRGVAGSLPLPSFTGGGAVGAVVADDATAWGVGCVVAFPANGTAAGTNLVVGACGGEAATVATFGVEYTDTNTVTFKWTTAGGAVTSVPIGPLTGGWPQGINGSEMLIYLTVAQNGTGIDWDLHMHIIDPAIPINFLTTGATLASQTLGPLAQVSVGVEVGSSGATLGTNNLSMGHVFATDGDTLNYLNARVAAARAYSGVELSTVALMVAITSGIQMSLATDPDVDTYKSGPVEVAPAAQNLFALEAAGQALLSDAAGFVGLEFRPVSGLESQDASFVISYAADTLTEPLRPTDDDQLTANDVTVTGVLGNAGRVTVLTGALGAQPGGIGRYGVAVTLPVPDQPAALDAAGWLAHLGTWDALRWPEITLEMVKPGNASLYMPTFSIGDVIQLTNLPAITGPTTVNLQVIGVSETLNSAKWQVTYVCRLADPWGVAVPERAARWDTIGDDVTVSSTDVYLGV